MAKDPDWLIDRLEDQPFGRFHLVTGIVALTATLAIGAAHLSNPEYFGRMHDRGSAGAIMLFFIGVAPAFLAALAWGQLVYPTAGLPPLDRTGPLSAYRLKGLEDRKWKLRVAAAAIGGANYLFLNFTAIHTYT